MADLWPSELPDTFETQGYSEQSSDNTISTKPEGGSRIVRKRYSAAPREVSGNMILDASQYAVLEAFYSIHQAERWQWTDVRGATRYYNFADAPKYTMLSGLYYRASLKLLEYTSEYGGG